MLNADGRGSKQVTRRARSALQQRSQLVRRCEVMTAARAPWRRC